MNSWIPGLLKSVRRHQRIRITTRYSVQLIIHISLYLLSPFSIPLLKRFLPAGFLQRRLGSRGAAHLHGPTTAARPPSSTACCQSVCKGKRPWRTGARDMPPNARHWRFTDSASFSEAVSANDQLQGADGQGMDGP